MRSIFSAVQDGGLEVVVVDDGSSKESVALLNRLFESNTMQMSLVLNDCHLGAAAARNIGMEYAHGDYIWFVDADDEIDSQALSMWWHKLTTLPKDVDILHLGPMIKESEIKTVRKKAKEADVFGMIDNSDFVIRRNSEIMKPRTHCLDHTTYWIKRQLLISNKDCRYPDKTTILEDSAFILTLLDKVETVATLYNCRLYIHKTTNDSLTAGPWRRKKSKQFLPSILVFFKQFKAFCEKHPDYPSLADLFHRYCYVYMRLMAVKGVPDKLYRTTFYEPVLRESFVPENRKERVLYNKKAHAAISLSCRIIRLFLEG